MICTKQKQAGFLFRISLLATLILAINSTAVAQVDVTIGQPADDRWHYPFNFTPGSRTTGSLFTASSNPGFDYRDAMVYLGFDTAGDVEGNRPLDDYQFSAVTITLWHVPGFYTWDTRTSVTNGAGEEFAMQVFGMGSNTIDLDTWTEATAYQGQGMAPQERNPYPLNIDDGATTQNVTNLIGATPWGTGVPVYGTSPGEYDPGTTTTVAFPVTFTLDVMDERVKRYIQTGLAKGRLLWTLSALADAGVMMITTDVPIFHLRGFAPNGDPLASMTIEDLELVDSTRMVTVDGSTEDRWHYPFNFTPGTRDNGSLFTASGTPGFDYRDGMIYMRYDFETSNDSDPAYVPSGHLPEQYEFTSFDIVLNHRAGFFTWDTRGTDTNGAGDEFAIQVFGMGSNTVDLATWDETVAYEGQGGGPPAERNPHPLNIDDNAPTQNVTNLVGAQAWGVGEPVYGMSPGQYDPGTTTTATFPVTFELNTADPRVKSYLQEGMSQGYLLFCFAATVDPASMSATGSGAPVFELNGFGPNPNASHQLLIEDFAITTDVMDWEAY
jgi:hypothetical protein